MVQYIINAQEKKIEIQGGVATIDELKDLYGLFEGYSFSFAPGKKYQSSKIIFDDITALDSQKSAEKQKTEGFGIQKGNEYKPLRGDWPM